MKELIALVLLGSFGFFMARMGSKLQERLDEEDDQLEDDETEDEPVRVEPGARCKECDEELDPATGVCENCLHDVIRRQEERETQASTETDPPPAEEREVERLRAFLAAEHGDKDLHCPHCLCELTPAAGACRECGKPALAMADLRPHLEQQLQDITAEWWAPVFDDLSVIWFAEILQAIDDFDPELQYRIRVSQGHSLENVSATLELRQRKSKLLFVKRKQLLRFRDLLLRRDFTSLSDLTRKELALGLEKLATSLPGRTN
jgi:hypothetical protein